MAGSRLKPSRSLDWNLWVTSTVNNMFSCMKIKKSKHRVSKLNFETIVLQFAMIFLSFILSTTYHPHIEKFISVHPLPPRWWINQLELQNTKMKAQVKWQISLEQTTELQGYFSSWVWHFCCSWHFWFQVHYNLVYAHNLYEVTI